MLGGVPGKVLADRMGCLKGGVVANVVVPAGHYVRFACHYGFRPDFCEAADPESKGIAENLVGYAKRDLMVPQAPFAGLAARVDTAAPTLVAMRRGLPLPADEELVVRGNAAVQAVAGTTLTLGILPRASAVALFASLVPTTIAGHGFWAIEDPAVRKLQRTQFHKNMAMLGGLLLAALDSPGPRNRRGASGG